MTKTLIRNSLIALGLAFSAQSVQAIPVDLELIIATDTSGSVDFTDFSLRRSGVEAAFRDATVIDAIENGAIGSIAVTLWDFGTNTGVAVDWMQISDAASSNAFADSVAGAGRLGGGGDGQALMLRTAATAIDNDFEATRSVVDIVSEGVQSGEGCSFTTPDCQATRDARDQFLAAGGSAVNALWMNDRDFFGLDADDLVDAFEYGSLSVIGGDGSFQTFAETNADFVLAFKDKIIREITDPPVDAPEPSILALLGIGLVGLGFARRKRS